METIFALATARGKAGVAVVRLSGDRAFDAAHQLVGHLPRPETFGLRKVSTAQHGVIDQCLVLVFEAPRSFTGEHVVEFHLHGSLAIVNAFEDALLSTGLVRRAEAGEFTKRALLNGQLDLPQVEALGDLIEAETEAQRLQAQSVLSGALRDKVELWRGLLVRAVSLLEATIDFVDEDVPVDVIPEVRSIIEDLCRSFSDEIRGVGVAERVREGFEVAIIGAPNAGKSTLLNALARRSIALTSDVPGTTRDVLEARLDLGGLPVTFLDTAGIRATDDIVERLGVERALERARAADLVVFLDDGNWQPPSDLLTEDSIVVRAKDDDGLLGGVSGATGCGLDELERMVADRLAERVAIVRATISQRQGEAILQALSVLSDVQKSLEDGLASELLSDDLRGVVATLGGIVGSVGVDDYLGDIFANFCIGK